MKITEGLRCCAEKKKEEQQTMYGCTDSLATNFVIAAEVDDGSCVFAGCTDSLAINFDPSAHIDDGSCLTWVE